MGFEEFIEDRLEEIQNSFQTTFENKKNFGRVVLALIIAIVMIKPAFQLSIITGLLFLGTIFWLFLFKTVLIAEAPAYTILVFIILAIRGAVGDLSSEAWLFFEKGDLSSALACIIAWAIIYFKTKELEKQ